MSWFLKLFFRKPLRGSHPSQFLNADRNMTVRIRGMTR